MDILLAQWQPTLVVFITLATELTILFLAISLFVGVLQRHIPRAHIESLLGGQRARGYFIAAGLGATTPFCSCSTIPMLRGMIRAGAGFGPMMVFLFASPLLDPIVIGVLLITFGWPLTAIYVSAALLVALLAGWTLHAFRFDRFLRPDVMLSSACGVQTDAGTPTSLLHRYRGLGKEVWQDFARVLPYLLVGVGIGSVIHNFVPENALSIYLGADNPAAIPVAAVIGVPLYLRASTIVPLGGVLIAKGVGAGAVLALIIGAAGISLPELILLRSLFRTALIVAFIAVVFTTAVSAGFATLLLF